MGGLDQRRLLKHLLLEKQYNPLERPVQNDSKTLPVRINLALQQIIDFVSNIDSIFPSMFNEYLGWKESNNYCQWLDGSSRLIHSTILKISNLCIDMA